MKTTSKRFSLFKKHLKHELGDTAMMLADGETVIILKNEFSPQQSFRTIQQAIDHFSRYMPDELKA